MTARKTKLTWISSALTSFLICTLTRRKQEFLWWCFNLGKKIGAPQELQREKTHPFTSFCHNQFRLFCLERLVLLFPSRTCLVILRTVAVLFWGRNIKRVSSHLLFVVALERLPLANLRWLAGLLCVVSGTLLVAFGCLSCRQGAGRHLPEHDACVTGVKIVKTDSERVCVHTFLRAHRPHDS